MEEVIQALIVVTDGGTRYKIIQYQQILRADGYDRAGRVDGMKSWRTSTNMGVEERTDGTFLIMQTGELARKIL